MAAQGNISAPLEDAQFGSSVARVPAVRLAVACYLLTSCAVLVAVWIGVYVLPSQGNWRGYLGGFFHGDGTLYENIAVVGYVNARPPRVAHFPAYPLIGRFVKQITGLPSHVALLLVTHGCLLAAFVALAKYLSVRWPAERPELTDLALLALGLWPSTLFFRMAYTESLFLLGAILSLYGMERRWPRLIIALIIGLATATRPVGMALVGVFAWHLWQESRREIHLQTGIEPSGFGGSRASTHPTPTPAPAALARHGGRIARFLGWSAVCLPLACWGLLAYMLFLHIEFHDALAFAHAQKQWVLRPTPLVDKLLPLLTLEPLWSPYVPGSTAYWRNFDPTDNPLLNFGFVCPIVFALSVALVTLGGVKKWLNARELILSALLLGIPYITMAYDNLMTSQLRFAAIVFPVYMVMARLLWPLPRWAIAVFFVTCALLLGMYSAYFAAGYGYNHRPGGVYRIFF